MQEKPKRSLLFKGVKKCFILWKQLSIPLLWYITLISFKVTVPVSWWIYLFTSSIESESNYPNWYYPRCPKKGLYVMVSAEWQGLSRFYLERTQSYFYSKLVHHYNPILLMLCNYELRSVASLQPLRPLEARGCAMWSSTCKAKVQRKTFFDNLNCWEFEKGMSCQCKEKDRSLFYFSLACWVFQHYVLLKSQIEKI